MSILHKARGRQTASLGRRSTIHNQSKCQAFPLTLRECFQPPGATRMIVADSVPRDISIGPTRELAGPLFGRRQAFVRLSLALEGGLTFELSC